MSANRVERTRRIPGRVTPAFIHNSSYFFVNLAVYADGLVDCWDLVDLPLLREKLRSGWVSTSVPNGEEVHVHHLGAWTVAEGSWTLDADALLERIEGLIRELNPRLENLYDMHGSTTETVGNLRTSKLELSPAEPVRADRSGPFARLIPGDSTWVFVRAERVYLADLRAFADGSIELGHLPEPETLNLQRLEEASRQGRVLSAVPPGTRIHIHTLGSFIAAEEQWSVKVEEILRSVPDLIDSANRRPTSVQRCIGAHNAYLADPTEEHRQTLLSTYEAVPAHLRRYIGDMDTKDGPVRSILYGGGRDED